MERFYETLFEVSNDYRHSILLLLKEKPMKITEVSKKLDLTTQEISRHISRLAESGLVAKDVEGFHHLTNYGRLIHVLLEEIEFVSKYRDYFINHSVLDLDPEFLKRLGDLSSSRYVGNTMEFLHFIDRLIKESKERVWLQVDQYPLTSLDSIVGGLKRGVRFRVIEQSEVLSGPRVNLESLEEAETLMKTRGTGLSEQRTLNEGGVFLFLSENKFAIAFPTKGASFDYKGFTGSDQRSVNWCSDLFNHYWRKTGAKQLTEREEQVKPTYTTPALLENGVAVIEGKNAPIDSKNLQYAVDNYDDLILRGTFDLGSSTINITRSVKIRGEKGAEQPKTRIYKRGWSYPLTKFDSVFEVNGKDIDVLIENLHFTDFDCSCINGSRARSLKVINNRFTLETGYGRGWKYHQFGDFLFGIWLDSYEQTEAMKNYAHGVLIQGNYFDFAKSQNEAGTSGQLNIREERTNQNQQTSYEQYLGTGIHVNNLSCRVDIKGNTIRNMNARGVSVADNFQDAIISIIDNAIYSEIPGAYPFKGVESGSGIFVQASFLHQRPGFKIDILGNKIQLKKAEYCGIIAINSSQSTDANPILRGNIIRNEISLENGQAGIKVGSDELDVQNNRIIGEGFFAVIRYIKGLPGSMTANEENERIKDNDISKFEIIDPRRWVSRRWPL